FWLAQDFSPPLGGDGRVAFDRPRGPRGRRLARSRQPLWRIAFWTVDGSNAGLIQRHGLHRGWPHRHSLVIARGDGRNSSTFSSPICTSSAEPIVTCPSLVNLF